MIPLVVITGILFDLFSLQALVRSWTQKKYVPGVPYISFFCYLVFFIWEYVASLDAGSFRNPFLLAAAALIIFNVTLHGLLHKMKKKYE